MGRCMCEPLTAERVLMAARPAQRGACVDLELNKPGFHGHLAAAVANVSILLEELRQHDCMGQTSKTAAERSLWTGTSPDYAITVCRQAATGPRPLG